MSGSGPVWRLRVATGCLLLSAMCFWQAPGLVVPDTKLDLTANPVGLMARALDLWDDSAFGQLQNQAYGYLFPSGPFHALLSGAGVPAWIVQRLWWSLILGVAFVGFWRLADALRVGSPWSRYLGAALFALSPRFLSEVAVTSIEVWPMAVAPWVLTPLLDPRPARMRARALRSALAFGCIGGVNAVATGAALILPVLWWVTRRPWRALLRPMLGWLGWCLAAGLWWLLPLLLLGRYSQPFLDWIEDARVTTSTASPFNALQGTTPWLGYLAGPGGASWPAAYSLISQPTLIVVTGVVAVLGLSGLAHPRMPHRGWLAVSALVGLFLLTVGFSSAASGPLADAFHGLLDGPLAPLRNTHKFDLVLRIPIGLGLVHAASVLARWRPVRALRVELVAAVAGLLVVAAAAPAVAANLPRPGGYDGIPQYWHEAAAWLDDAEGQGAVLVLPSASFADFTWGSTRDEPLQALMQRPFVVRDAVPLGGAGSTRLLDEVTRRLTAGMGSPDLARVLGEAGIRFLVVRNDLLPQSGVSRPVPLHEAIDESGFIRRASFGPPTGYLADAPGVTVDDRMLVPYPSVEIFDGAAASAARFVPLDQVQLATAGPENLVDIAGSTPDGVVSILGSDRLALGDLAQGLPEVVTDGLRRRDVAFGSSGATTSEVLADGDPGTTGRRTIDYISDRTAAQTVTRWRGVRSVTASSSASDAGATLRLGPGTGPAAALDADPLTRWVSGTYGEAVGQWLELGLAAPQDISGLTIQVSGGYPIQAQPTRVRVSTDTGSVTTDIVETDTVVPLATPPGRTTRVRVELDAVGSGAPNGFGIAELTVPGVHPVPELVIPAAAPAAPAQILSRVEVPALTGCAFVATRSLCSPALVRSGEETAGIFRSLTLAAGAAYELSGTVLPGVGGNIERLLDFPGRITATASSSRVQSPAARPATVADADLGTGWVAGDADPSPRLRLDLPQARTVTRLQFLLDPYLAASRPTSVTVTGDDGTGSTVPVDAEGYAAISPNTGRGLDIDFLSDSGASSIDSVSGFAAHLPVGVSEVRLEGADDLRAVLDPTRTVAVPCGFGPSVLVDDTRLPTQVEGTVEQVLRGAPLRWSACPTTSAATVDLAAGRHTLSAAATTEFRPYQLLLRRVDAPPSAAAASTSASQSIAAAGDGGWAVPQRAQPGMLVLSHNANPGWVATDGQGQALPSVRVNGWQQGWVLPAGAATVVHTRYAPQPWYAAGLAVGGVAFLALLVLWLLSTRPRGKPRNEIAESDGGSVALSGALTGSASGGWLLAVLLVVTFPVNAGLVGVLAVVIGAVVGYAGRRWPRLGVTPVVVLGAGAVAAVAAAPWGEGGAALMSVGVQQLVLAAFAGVAASGTSGTALPRWVPSAGRPRRVSVRGGGPGA